MQTRPDPARVEQLFHVVADLGAEKTARILDRKCERQGALRSAVERLLRRDRQIGSSFLAPNAALLSSLFASAGRAGAMESGSEDAHGSPEKVGRFEVLERLGAGAMAVIYLGYDPSLDRRVALKVLRRGLELPEFLAREARALARLTHPNVVQVYETGEHNK